MLAGVILSQKLTKAVILIMPWGSDQPWDTLRYQVMMLIHSLRNTAASSHHTLNETLAIQSCSGNLTPECEVWELNPPSVAEVPRKGDHCNITE